MNVIRYGRAVYPRSFAWSVPVPESWDDRPLPNLLRGQQSHPRQEIDRIERWYSELRGPKKTLRGRLRSSKPRDFWAGLYELMTSRIFVERAWSYRYEPHLKGKTPDFLVQCPDGFRFIAEVLTVFQDPQMEKVEAEIHRVASCLNQISHPFGVILEEVVLPSHTVSLKPVLTRVRAWLDQCKPGRSQSTTISLRKLGTTLRLCSLPDPRPAPAPIVLGVVGIGGRITSTERIQKAMQRKVDKYGNTKALGLPLVLFAWQGDWLKVTDTSLEWALFGRLQAHISRQDPSRPAIWTHAPGGLFTFWKDGKPQNTAVSGIIYCSRIPHRGRVYARIQVYHHPYAAHPLPLVLFNGVPQFVPFHVTRDGFSCKWDRQHRGRGMQLN